MCGNQFLLLHNWLTFAQAHVMDPKAITKDELYGVLDASTLEWTDGMFTHCVRKVIDNQRGEVCFFLFFLA